MTHAESVGEWRELLAGAGVKSARIAGAGIFKDAASDLQVRDLFFNSTLETWQIIMYVVGAILLLAYFKRRSDRLSRHE